jgi:starch-binding outer membrane protein SusE/F
MKNIFKSLLTLFLAAGLTSCENESNKEFLTPAANFKITSPSTNANVVLNPLYPTNPALTLTWEAASFGTPTSVDYSIQVAKAGTNFASVTTVTSTTNKFVTLNVEQLNGAAVNAQLPPFVQGGLDIRIKASVAGSTEYVKLSNSIVYLVTPYTTELPKLAVPGNHQGWNPPTAPKLAASAFGATDYEGYIYLNGGHKFVAPDATGNFNWGNTDYGANGSSTSTLLEQNESDIVATAGYYRIQANTTALTFNETLTNWGIIGAATPNGWNSSTQLTYNATTKKWEGIMALTAGEYKFRANQDWGINLGKDNNNDDSMDYDGPNLSVAAAGSYKVELDLSNPRKYKHTITLQ